jgi:hypothetical protein
VNNNININRSNNIYNSASGARPSFSGRGNNFPGKDGAGRPAGGGFNRPDNNGGGFNRPSGGDFKVPSGAADMKNNVVSDKSGNVFRNEGGDWKNMNNNAGVGRQLPDVDRSNLNRQQFGQDRGEMRTNNFNNFNRGGGGMARPGMGGGGLRR